MIADAPELIGIVTLAFGGSFATTTGFFDSAPFTTGLLGVGSAPLTAGFFWEVETPTAEGLTTGFAGVCNIGAVRASSSESELLASACSSDSN